MNNSVFDKFLPKMRKVHRNHKNYKYDDNFVFILNDHKKGLELGELEPNTKPIYNRRCSVYYDLSSDDEDIDINNNHLGSFVTCAIIEPIPYKFRENDLENRNNSNNKRHFNIDGNRPRQTLCPSKIEMLRKEIEEQQAITIVSEEEEEEDTAPCNREFNKYLEYEEVSAYSDSFDRLLNGYGRLRKWNRISLIANNNLNNFKSKTASENSPKTSIKNCYESKKSESIGNNFASIKGSSQCFEQRTDLNNINANGKIKANSIHDIHSEFKNTNITDNFQTSSNNKVTATKNYIKPRNYNVKNYLNDEKKLNNIQSQSQDISGDKEEIVTSITSKINTISDISKARNNKRLVELNGINKTLSTDILGLNRVEYFRGIRINDITPNSPFREVETENNVKIAENLFFSTNKHFKKTDLEKPRFSSQLSRNNLSKELISGTNSGRPNKETQLSDVKINPKRNSNRFKTQLMNDYNNESSSKRQDRCSKRKDNLLAAILSEENDGTTSVNDKFVVNIFESRASERWIRQTQRKIQCDKIQIINDCPNEMSHNKTPANQIENPFEAKKDTTYYEMRKLRDIECVKMKEASSALWVIKNSVNRRWEDELLAETILLETQLRYKLIVSKIRENKDVDAESIKRKITGSITLSNLQYELTTSQKKKTTDSTTFFILAVSHDTILLTTKAVEATEDGTLTFNETLTLKELDDGFKIKAEIFAITLNTAKTGIVQKLLKRKPKCCCPIRKIYYENVNTSELKESSVLKPSFKSLGEFSVATKDIGTSTFFMQKQENCILKNTVKLTIKVNQLHLHACLSGFLTLGKEDEENNVHYWERKWCSLKGNTFSIYNYPQDEEFERPAAAKVSLEYCLNPLLKNPKDCPRKKTFILRTGRPSILNDSNYKKLGRYENFILTNHYLSADNQQDFEQWTSVLDSSLEQLSLWHRLVLKQ